MKIQYSKQAEKFLKKQDSQTRNRILNAIHHLPGGDVKKLQGRNGNILYIERIDNRGQVYKEV